MKYRAFGFVLISLLCLFPLPTQSWERSGNDMSSQTPALPANLNSPPGCMSSGDTIFVMRAPEEVNLILATDDDGDLEECQLLTGPGMVEGCQWSYIPPESDTFALSWMATDGEGGFCQDTINVIIWIIPYVCGDANDDGTVNVGDPVYLISYIFKGGPAPDPLQAGDANCDYDINVGDPVYLISYIFKGGPRPCCPDY